MVLLVDYNTLKIVSKIDSPFICLIELGTISDDKNIIHTPRGFYFDDSLLKSDDYWFNEFIKTSDYKTHMLRYRLKKLKKLNNI